MPTGDTIAVSTRNVSSIIEGEMKLNLIGFAILLLTMAMANSQGTTNMSEKTEEYLNPGEPIKVKAGQGSVGSALNGA